ncbi:MAG: formylglycine-generating enzyme family protein [Polyangiaceae bacterium]|nr:formylglycine-generating enzyme family protein [Polyangiaceae bacterium]
MAAATNEPAAPPAPEGMLLVRGGTFTMGADKGGEADEHPAHEVTVGSFWLDVTEVTNGAYGECVATGTCREHDPKNAERNGFDDRTFRGAAQPVSGVSWDDAVAYCTFRGKRLPTEAEWERAARGDDGRTYPWGEESPTPEHGVFSSSVTADVGTHPQGAGPFGHLDLAGNVWEWCADHYDPFAYTRPAAKNGRPGDCTEILRAQDKLRKEHRDGFTGTNPIPTECERVLRGGAFNYPARGLRVTNRVHHPGRFRLVMSGLRCARDVTPPESSK